MTVDIVGGMGFSVSGVTTLSGTILVLDSATGVWEGRGGAIGGAALSVTKSAQAVLADATAMLDGVVLAANLTVVDGATLTVHNGIEIQNKVITLSSSGSGARLVLEGTQAINGMGEIQFGGSSNSGEVLIRGLTNGASATVTFDSGILVRGIRGGSVRGASATDSIVNGGTIRAETSGTTVTVSLPTSNSGTLEARNGATLVVSDLLSNTGAIVKVPGSTVIINGVPI